MALSSRILRLYVFAAVSCAVPLALALLMGCQDDDTSAPTDENPVGVSVEAPAAPAMTAPARPTKGIKLPVRTFICWYRPGKEAPGDEVMARYDLVIGQGCPPERRQALRKLNPNIRFVAYVNVIDRALTPDVPGVEYIPQGAERGDHDPFVADIWANHRDFLLKTPRGVRGQAHDAREAYAWGYQRPYDRTSRYANRFFLDPRTGWRDAYAELCVKTTRADGYDGVFCDNAGPRIERTFRRVPDDLRPKVTDAEWSAAMAKLLAGAKRRLTRAGGGLVYANTCGGFVRNDAEDIEPTAFWRDARIDGAMDEFFACTARGKRGQSYLSEARWRRQIRAMLCCERIGRGYLAQSNGGELDHDARLYALASFLIGAGERSAFNYNPAGAPTYPLVYRFPEWDIDLGRPRAHYGGVDEALVAGGGRVYARLFERGMAVVNPSDQPRIAHIGAGLRRLSLEGGTISHGGRAFGGPAGESIELAPHSAAILLREP